MSFFMGADKNKVKRILKSKRILIVWMALGLLLLVLAGIEQSSQQKPQSPEQANGALGNRA